MHSLVIAFGLLLAASPATVQEGQIERVGAAALVRVPSTKVWLAPPAGFGPATTFAGFQHVDSGSTILVNSLPASFAESKRTFDDPKNLAKQGMERIAREELAAGTHPGILLHLRQTARGIEFEKWLWVFGSADETVMILGTYPAARAEEYSSVLRNAVRSARWDPQASVNPLDGLGFSFAHTGTLEFHSRNGNNVVYAETGETDPKLRATLVMGPAIQSAVPADRRAFAAERLRQTVLHRDFEIESVEPGTVDSLEGFEVVATAVSDSGVPTTIYQLMLFEGATYWLAQGIVRSSERERFLPMFRKVARSFTRDRRRFESEGGLARVTAPSGWTELDLSDDAELEIGHPTAECYLMVLSEAKSDLRERLTIDEHSTKTRGGMKEAAGVEREEGPRQLEIGGKKCVQYELHTPTIVFVHTTLETQTHFHQIVAWTLAPAFAAGRNALDAVIATFESGG